MRPAQLRRCGARWVRCQPAQSRRLPARVGWLRQQAGGASREGRLPQQAGGAGPPWTFAGCGTPQGERVFSTAGSGRLTWIQRAESHSLEGCRGAGPQATRWLWEHRQGVVHTPPSASREWCTPPHQPAGSGARTPISQQGVVHTPPQQPAGSGAHTPSSQQEVVHTPHQPAGSGVHTPISQQGVVHTPPISQQGVVHTPPSTSREWCTPPSASRE
eukprot:gene3959-biopygen14392